jgi:hypothetical protein
VTFRAFKTFVLKIFGGSDKSRWRNSQNLLQDWEPRTARMANWIPKGSRVIEFGAGNQKLKSMLDATCVYFASDLVDRGNTALVCDLNKRPLPDFSHLSAQVAVFSGVLEYIHDVKDIAQWLSTQAEICICSYSCFEPRQNDLLHIKTATSRASNGWVNSYTEAQIVEIFGDAGFSLANAKTWEQQRLFLFERRRGTA